MQYEMHEQDLNTAEIRRLELNAVVKQQKEESNRMHSDTAGQEQLQALYQLTCKCDSGPQIHLKAQSALYTFTTFQLKNPYETKKGNIKSWLCDLNAVCQQ